MDLDDALDELYGCARAEFVGRRRELTRSARSAGNPDLAREVVALRMALTDVSGQVVTRDVLRQELKSLLAQLDDSRDARESAEPAAGSREP